MANKGWPNEAGGGEQTSSTARQSGRGSTNADKGFIDPSQIAHPGSDNDPLAGPGDLFEVPGQLSETKSI